MKSHQCKNTSMEDNQSMDLKALKKTTKDKPRIEPEIPIATTAVIQNTRLFNA